MNSQQILYLKTFFPVAAPAAADIFTHKISAYIQAAVCNYCLVIFAKIAIMIWQ